MLHNRAFIDGQNLHLGVASGNWSIDLMRFRIYLKDKYNISYAYYFLGYKSDQHERLYSYLRDAGYLLIFREHLIGMTGKKKGNVDTDIVFEIGKGISDKHLFDKIVLVSGDGDYKKLVDYLIQKGRFLKILFPNSKFASSLYKNLGAKYYDYLDASDIRQKIESLK